MRRFSSFALLALLGGCAGEGSGRYPSLLPRPVEHQDLAEPVHAPAIASPDPTLDARIAALDAGLAETAKAFDDAARPAEAATQAARGAKPGDDRWVRAQAALAGLSDGRTRALATVTELEQLEIGRASDGLPDYPALGTASRAAAAELDRESATIKRLSDQLAPA